jgi:PAS domain S-box-containing protein
LSGAPEASSARPSGAASLLVATSDATTRDLLRKALHVPAVDVVEAHDGVEALALVRRLELDLVLLDAFLAVLDGISVCARIRALSEVNQPAIAIMGLSSERTVELAFSEGADEILTKPLNPTLIRQRVELLLRRRQADKRMRLLEQAVAAAGSGITILDARSSEYPLVHANPAFLAMTGYSAEELSGKNLRLLRGAETDVASTTEMRDAFSAGRSCRVLMKNYRKDGSTFWNDLQAAPLRDPVGRITHYVAVQTDVSERMKPGKLAARDLEEFAAQRTKELELVLARVEDRRRFTETVLNGLSAALITTDVKGNVSFANRAALHTLGMSLADCMGRSVVEVFGGNEEVREVTARATERVEARLDFPMISPGGVRLYVGMSVIRVPEELREELSFLFLFRNLAEAIEAREKSAAASASAGEPSAAAAPAGDRDSAQGEVGAEADPAVGGGGSASLDAARRRPVLALRYCAPGDLLRQAAQVVAAERPEDDRALAIDVANPIAEVLVDRDQVAEALSRLLGNAVQRAGALHRVRVRLSMTEALGERGVKPVPFVRVDILFPREQITDEDLGADGEGGSGHWHRRSELVAAEQLLQANGGRLVNAPASEKSRSLSALIPASPRPLATEPE